LPDKRSARLARAILSAFACAVWLLAATACAHHKRSARTARVTPAPPVGWTETGLASWYGEPYNGRRAANGEIYDMDQLTAAHRTLPFGAIVRVANLTNSKRVEVRITDRGPFIEGRIIDLSRAAARQIDLIRPGVARVRLEIIGYGLARPGVEGAFAAQVGEFSHRKQAEKLCRRLARHYSPVDVYAPSGTASAWRVIVGRRSSARDAEVLAEALRHEYKEVFVVRLD
jgi:rare lipoprotein A